MALIVAHNFHLKGVDTLLASMRRLQTAGRETRLVIVGGKHIDSWQRHVARLGLSEQVVFVGRVDDPLPYYAAADYYVHPTYYDPCSLVVLEAAACGLPLITSRYNGASELFCEGKDMILIDDPADDVELAEAMRLLLDDSTRQRLGEAARQRSCNIRSIETSTRSWGSIKRSSTAAADCRTAIRCWKARIGGGTVAAAAGRRARDCSTFLGQE